MWLENLTQDIIRVSSELFPLDAVSQKTILDRVFCFYRLDAPSELLKRFGSIYSIYSHVARVSPNPFSHVTVLSSEDRLELISSRKVEPTEMSISLEGTTKIDLTEARSPRHLDLNLPDELRALLHLFYESQRDAFRSQGYSVRANGVYRTDADLAADMPQSHDAFLSKIQPFIHVFAGFEFQLRILNGSLYLQIQPKSILEFEKDIHSLVTEGILSPREVLRRFQDQPSNVYLPNNTSAHLVGIVPKRADEPISEEPFSGRTFLEFAKSSYKGVTFSQPDAALLVVVVGPLRTPWYFTSEHVKPYVSFPILARYDRRYVGTLTSLMKVYSSKRVKILEDLRRDLKFSFLGDEIKIGGALSREGVDLEIQPEIFSDSDLSKPFFRFPKPWVRFRDANGSIREVGPPFLAAPGDLLRNRELTPFDVPKSEIKLKVICDERLEKDARALIARLEGGLARYPRFDQIFRCSIKYDISSTTSFTSGETYSDVSPEKYDCVLLFGPRNIADDPLSTKLIYTFAETHILDKGVPAQFVSDDPSSNPIYDASLKSKARNPNALFGIGPNILGKIGARVLDLSSRAANHFMPDSVVLSYNIARVFRTLDLGDSQASPREVAKASIPLSAPIVVMSDRGTEIIHQYAHELSKETALFSSDHAFRILDEIAEKYSKVVVHKDGAFLNEELSDLRNLQSRRTMIPVSIVSGKVPRLFSSIPTQSFLPRTGLLFGISKSDFLMSTTLVTDRYVPEARGWPNPIWVRIHDEVLPERLTAREKIQLLYQIWAFTRLHLGSENPIRRPISIHYSNQMAEFLRKAGNPEPSYFKLFSKNANRHGYVPRVFM
jgi:hypothetical protein